MYNIFNEGGSGIKKNNNKNKKKPKGFFTIPIFLFVFVLGLFFPLLPIQSVATYATSEIERPFFTNYYRSISYQGETFELIGYGSMLPEQRRYFNSLPFYRMPTANDLVEETHESHYNGRAIFVSTNWTETGRRGDDCNISIEESRARFIAIPAQTYQEAIRSQGDASSATLSAVSWRDNYRSLWFCTSEDRTISGLPTITGIESFGPFEWNNCTEGPNMITGSVIIDRGVNKTFNYKSGPPGLAIFEDSTTGKQINVRLVPGANSCTFLPMNGVLLPSNITVEITNPRQIKPTAAAIEGTAFVSDLGQATGVKKAPVLPIVITGTDPSFEKTVNTNDVGAYEVLLPCGNTYTLRVEHKIDGDIQRWLKEASDIYDAITVDDLIIGTSHVSISDQASGCVATPSGPIDISLRLESRSPLEKAMISSISIMMGLVNFALSHIGEWINSLLIGGNEIERTEGLEAAWNSVRNMTLSLLTLLLLLVAFANILSINMEQYGLVKIIPKIIVAIILAYFSLLISSFLLDLMSALQSLLVTGMGDGKLDIAAQTNSISMGAGDIASGVIEQLFLLFIGFGILFTAAWLALLLIVRNAMLLFLVAVSPLAFLCNILPFTEKYYKQWWASFWKWMFIGPAVLFMLWLAGTFLGSYQEAKFLGEESRSLEGLFWLTATAVMIALAALLPLKMGGEIYGQIQKGWGNKHNPIKNRLDARTKSKDNARALHMQKKQAELAQGRLGPRGMIKIPKGIGRLAAGMNEKQAIASRDGLKGEMTKELANKNSEELNKMARGKGIEAEVAQDMLLANGDMDFHNKNFTKEQNAAFVERIMTTRVEKDASFAKNLKEQKDFHASAALAMYKAGRNPQTDAVFQSVIKGANKSLEGKVEDLTATSFEYMEKHNPGALLALAKDEKALDFISKSAKQKVKAAAGRSFVRMGNNPAHTQALNAITRGYTPGTDGNNALRNLVQQDAEWTANHGGEEIYTD